MRSTKAVSGLPKYVLALKLEKAHFINSRKFLSVISDMFLFTLFDQIISISLQQILSFIRKTSQF